MTPVEQEGRGAVQFSWAVLTVVPHPHTGECANVGVVVHSRPAEYLGMRVLTDRETLGRLAPDADVEMLVRYLESCRAIAAGDRSAAPIALLSMPERFHWLTSPRSDVIQPSPVEHGATDDPAAELERIFRERVRAV